MEMYYYDLAYAHKYLTNFNWQEFENYSKNGCVMAIQVLHVWKMSMSIWPSINWVQAIYIRFHADWLRNICELAKTE